jgi:soluble lytic murein transglycosylase
MKRFGLPAGRELLLFLEGAILVLIIWGITVLVTHSHLPLKPQSATITSPWVPSTVKKWEPQIDQMAKKYQIDPNLIAIIMTMESGGNPKAKSEAGAVGLMQITPITGKDIANMYLKEPRAKYNLEDPATNVEFGTAYLALLRKTFGDWRQGPTWDQTVEQVAAAYNGGFGAANSLIKGQGMTDTQTVVYSRDAFNMWRERHAAKSPTFDRWKERGGQALIDDAKKQI